MGFAAALIPLGPVLFGRINEETFWRNYFYRVSLIRQSSELSSLAQEGHDSKDSSRTSSVEVAEPAKGQSRSGIAGE